MDRIEIRIHDEISDVAEKYYGFTFRQWITFLLTAVICVPSYLFLTPVMGTDLAGWVVILEAVPIVGIGLIPIQGMKAEKVLPFWIRYYLNFNKPLVYKTEKERLAELEEKRHKRKSKSKKVQAAKAVSEELPQTKALKSSRKEAKQQKKLEKQRRLQEKKQRQYQKELAKAKKHFGIMDDIKQDFDREKKLYSSGELDSMDVQAIIRLGKQLEKLEGNYETDDRKESETTEDQ